MNNFSKCLDTIRENFINIEILQNAKHDIQKKLGWFVIVYIVHNIVFKAHSRKSFRPQSSDDETVLADETDNVWDPDWSHSSIINITFDTSSAAIATISVN